MDKRRLDYGSDIWDASERHFSASGNRRRLIRNRCLDTGCELNPSDMDGSDLRKNFLCIPECYSSSYTQLLVISTNLIQDKKKRG